MASAKDLINKSGGGAMFNKPAGTPITPPAKEGDKAGSQPHGVTSGKPAKGYTPKMDGKGAAGGTTPIGVRPKV